jgi:hypothetical protein
MFLLATLRSIAFDMTYDLFVFKQKIIWNIKLHVIHYLEKSQLLISLILDMVLFL